MPDRVQAGSLGASAHVAHGECRGEEQEVPTKLSVRCHTLEKVHAGSHGQTQPRSRVNRTSEQHHVSIALRANPAEISQVFQSAVGRQAQRASTPDLAALRPRRAFDSNHDILLTTPPTCNRLASHPLTSSAGLQRPPPHSTGRRAERSVPRRSEARLGRAPGSAARGRSAGHGC